MESKVWLKDNEPVQIQILELKKIFSVATLKFFAFF